MKLIRNIGNGDREFLGGSMIMMHDSIIPCI